jgi:hypothetical protein
MISIKGIKRYFLLYTFYYKSYSLRGFFSIEKLAKKVLLKLCGFFFFFFFFFFFTFSDDTNVKGYSYLVLC